MSLCGVNSATSVVAAGYPVVVERAVAPGSPRDGDIAADEHVVEHIVAVYVRALNFCLCFLMILG